MIKDCYIDRVISRIPKELMTFEDANEANLVINRFKWISERQFLICSEDGIEKIVDIDKGYKEIEYNYRPLFNGIEIDEKGKPKYPEWHKCYYYIQREDISE